MLEEKTSHLPNTWFGLAAIFHTHPIPDGTLTGDGGRYNHAVSENDIRLNKDFSVPGIVAWKDEKDTINFISYDENGVCP
jgi:hypothetical protein